MFTFTSLCLGSILTIERGPRWGFRADGHGFSVSEIFGERRRELLQVVSKRQF